MIMWTSTGAVRIGKVSDGTYERCKGDAADVYHERCKGDAADVYHSARWSPDGTKMLLCKWRDAEQLMLMENFLPDEIGK